MRIGITSSLKNYIDEHITDLTDDINSYMEDFYVSNRGCDYGDVDPLPESEVKDMILQWLQDEGSMSVVMKNEPLSNWMNNEFIVDKACELIKMDINNWD